MCFEGGVVEPGPQCGVDGAGHGAWGSFQGRVDLGVEPNLDGSGTFGDVPSWSPAARLNRVGAGHVQVAAKCDSHDGRLGNAKFLGG